MPGLGFYPNASTIAEFHPHSLTLHFNRFNRATLEQFAAGEIAKLDRRDIETIWHELTHWSDQVSSVWGQTYLVKLFQAHDAAAGNNEYEFVRVIEQYDEDRRVLQPMYYHVVEKSPRPHDERKPWRISFSAGQEFASDGHLNEMRPIFFVAFSDNESGARIARQPITVGSLLETTAVWSELRIGMSIIGSTEPEEVRIVDRALWERNITRQLYDHELTVYSAPVHMLARRIGLTDPLVAYERGAVLAHVALQLTDLAFGQIAIPEGFGPFGARNERFLKARDRGYAFAVMAEHAANVDVSQSVEKWLAEVLERCGLPPLWSIMHQAFQELDVLGRGPPVRSQLDRTRDYLLEVGRQRFANRGNLLGSGKLFDPLGGLQGPLPPMFDENADVFYMGAERLDTQLFDPEVMYRAELNLRGFTKNFLQGCRGLGGEPQNE